MTDIEIKIGTGIVHSYLPLCCKKFRFQQDYFNLNKKSSNANCIRTYSGGEDATRTHNALRHTTFPMWLLTIRIPLHMQL